jgi:type 1 glutamine amidotransferase
MRQSKKPFGCLPAFMVAAAAALSTPLAGSAASAADEKTLEVLYITGGCCHDYEGQKAVIAKALASRARIKTTVVHEGGSSNDHRISIYEKPDWSKGYDVVFHNECFSHVKDPEFLKKIVVEHEKGTPAVMMHCAMHCYRAGNDDWFKLCGIKSPGHGAHYEYTANVIADHPIVNGLPKEWSLPKEELYYCDKLFETAKPLAEAMSRERNAMQTVAWTNEYGRARVFGTTIGHYTHTVETPEFLDLVTRGTLWAARKLQADGSPAAELALSAGEIAAVADWSHGVKLPSEEQARCVSLFNGRDFEGWEGHMDYWSIEGGEIVAKNTTANAPKVSTYLLTKKPYRNFRLLLEGKLVTSEMHSGVAIWGKKFEKDGETSSYQGHLVMFPSGWGLYDLFRRNGLSGDQEGRAKAAAEGRQHDWNRLEILAIGSRIRLAVNGREVLDWTDPNPELCGEGPIGLQLHSNAVPQEVRFRGLVLVENPIDSLVTAEPTR